MTTETITIQVEYGINYKTERGRDDAIRAALEVTKDTMGAGLNGLYRARRGKAYMTQTDVTKV